MIENGKRALVYTATVTDIKPIEGYDFTEYAQINNGWWCVISKKDNFKVGDTCVYFEVDSLVPKDDKRFEFLEKKKYRIKTQKLCKVISQGLAMPLSAFPELKDVGVGVNVTDTLRVEYYDPEDNERKKGNPNAKYQSMNMRHKKLSKKKWWKWLMKRQWGRNLLFRLFGRKRDNPRYFPTTFAFVHKTDEERIENLPHMLHYEEDLIMTEKLDGTSSTYILERKGHKFEFYVCSRNIRMADENADCYHDHNIYWDMAFKYNIEEELKQYLESHPSYKYACIQGESVGSVQGNPLKLEEDDLYVFNFIDSEHGRFGSLEGKEIIEEMGMKWVPILGTFNMKEVDNDMEKLKQFTDSKSVVNTEVLREGIVFRNKRGEVSFKSVSREYLMKK